MSEIIIREASFSDLYFVAQLKDKELGHYNGPGKMALFKVMAEEDGTEILVSERREEDFSVRLGYAALQWQGDKSYLVSIAVIPEARRCGVGEMLVEECKKRTLALRGPHLIALEVSENNLPGRTFSPKLPSQSVSFSGATRTATAHVTRSLKWARQMLMLGLQLLAVAVLVDALLFGSACMSRHVQMLTVWNKHHT
jgi:GNAT superfamily N-acetyltransferase